MFVFSMFRRTGAGATRGLLGLVKERHGIAVKLTVRALSHDFVDDLDPLEVTLQPVRDATADFLTVPSLGRREYLYSIKI